MDPPHGRRVDAPGALRQGWRMDARPTPADVLAFWREAGPSKWFARRAAFDAAVRERFEALHLLAATGALESWSSTADGALARVIVLDQFPRNLYRDSAHAFATDPLALSVANAAIADGFDAEIESALRAFLYMPLMHAEDAAVQARCVRLFETLAREAPETQSNLKFARIHADVIARFGRFPHRNGVFGRATTVEEQAFLDEGGFSG